MTTLVDFISYAYFSGYSIFRLSNNEYPDYSGVLRGNWPWGHGQAFVGNGLPLNSCQFFLKKYNNPVGNIYARLYNSVSGLPNGQLDEFGGLIYDEDGRMMPFATSDPIDMSTISSTGSWVTFTFSGENKYVLSNEYGNAFFIVLEIPGSTSPDLETGVHVGMEDTINLGRCVVVDPSMSFFYFVSLQEMYLIFSVYSDDGTDPAPDAPTLTTPINDYDVTTFPFPNFYWTEPAGAAKYRFQLSSTNDFTSLIHDFLDSTMGTYPITYDMRQSQNHDFYWRVAAANSESTWGDWSTTFHFSLHCPYNPDGSGIGGTTVAGGYIPVLIWVDTDISNKVISYTRNIEICTGVGTLELILVDDGTSYDLWEKIILYENGRKKGIFYISSSERNEKDGTKRLLAQDGSKLLMDYFIKDSYTIDYESYTGYWITKFIEEAKVKHGEIGTGVVLSDGTQLGLSSAYDTIQTLLQYSGWYIYFDNNGVAQIGSMTVGSSKAITVDDKVIQSVSTNKNDSMLRNRAVVWGNSDTTTSESIFSDMTVRTPYNYDANDIRAILISNSAIATQADADNLARKLIKEFSKINYEKTIGVIGEVDITVGGFLNVKSMGWTGLGLVTTVEVNFSSNGLVTTLILDQRCPRLFAFWGDVDDYVYIGTTESGVWRKPLDEYNWEAFNDGLPSGEINVSDLYINSNIFGTIIDSGNFYYRNYSPSGEYDSEWILYTPSGLTNELGVTISDVLAKGLTINHETNDLIVGYNSIESGNDMRSWVVEINQSGELIDYNQVYVASGDYSCHIIDLDTNDVDNIVSVESSIVVSSGIPFGDMGWFTNPEGHMQDESYTFLPPSGLVTNSYDDYNFMVDGYTWNFGNVITQNTGNNNAYAYYLYQPTSASTNLTLRRVKFPELIVSEIDLESDVGGILYKENDDDLIYITSTTDMRRVSFETGTVLDTTSFSLTTPSLTHSGKYAYNFLRTVTGTSNYTITYSYERVDMTTGEVSTVTMGSITMDGCTASKHSMVTGGYTNCARMAGGMIFMENYRAGNTTSNDECGVIYGSDAGVHKHVYWTNPGGYGTSIYNILGTGPVCGFIGNKGASTCLLSSFEFSATKTGEPNVVKSLVTYIDDALSPIITEYDGVSWNDDPDVPKGYIGLANFTPLSNRYGSTLYFISGTTNRVLTGLTVRQAPDGTTYKEIAASDYGFERIIPLANHPIDDTSGYIYIGLGTTTGWGLWGVDSGWNLKRSYAPGPSGTNIISSDLYTANSIVVSRYRTDGFSYRYINYNMRYFEPNIDFPGSAYTILWQQDNIFTPVLYTDVPYQVEISKTYPIEVYNITTSGIYPIYQADIPSGEWSTITTEFETYDGRIFDIQNPDVFVATSGVIGSGLRYFGLASDEGLKAFPTNLIDGTITIFESGITHLETTNNTNNPYIFVSAAGETPKFYQQNPPSGLFVDYSAYLPNSEITCIRIDDII